MTFLNLITKEKIADSIIPISIIGAVINTGYTLKDKNFDNEFSNFIVPSFLLFFSAPLSANIIYKQMLIDSYLVMYYLAGVFLFFMLRDVIYARKICFIFPIILRLNFLLGLKDVNQPISLIFMYMTFCEFNSLILRKMFLEGGRLNFKNRELKGLIENIIVTYLIRNFSLPNYSVYSLIVVLEHLHFAEGFLKAKKEIKRRGRRANPNKSVNEENKTVLEDSQSVTGERKRGRKKKEVTE
ncbi:hypothetical protein TUBRATIS_14730 [Tubulinosema ratisbonensis]|uniref:Uncharacterized protein n=1 Tax=Tubulinosema ratisbonensis TaxID=291195 RepID=A0A437ALT0_9MICR|nr:hypothetical protein TUBRATIS_14730 [Tubulinosema ratisbonensis]